MVENKQNQLLKGAFILTLAGLISKVLSALYRIPLQNLTGDYGYYVYQQIYPFIGMLMMLSLYGFPAAVSKLTSEQQANNKDLSFKKFTRPILIILFSFSLSLAAIMFGLAPYLTNLVGDEKLIASYQLVSLGFLLIPLTSFYRGYFQGSGDMKPTAYSQVLEQLFSVGFLLLTPIAFYRGYFQGIGDMKPTAFSQVFEQLFRVSIIVVVAFLISRNFFDTYALGVWSVYATLFSGVIGTIVLYIFKIKKPKEIFEQVKSKVPWRYFIKVLFLFGIIAALNHMILLLLQFADVFTLVPYLIDSGYAEIEAMEMKGIFDRGQPLIQFGAVLGSSFALALIPEITSRKKEWKEKTLQTIKDTLTISFYIAAGATLGLIFILPEANILLFEDKSGTKSLQILMFAILFGSIAVTSNAILQSYGYYKEITMFIVSMFFAKIILNYLFVPKLGIIGSSLATTLSLLILTIFSLLFLKLKLTKTSFVKMINWRAFIYGSISMVSFLLITQYFLGNYIIQSRFMLLIYVMIIVGIGGSIYLLVLLRYDALSKRQLKAFPLTNIIFKLQQIAKFKKER